MVQKWAGWSRWFVTFFCACSTAVPEVRPQRAEAEVLVIRPAGYQPVQLTREELQQGMRMLLSRGPLPGAPRGGSARFRLVSADALHLEKAAGYLRFCERLTGTSGDCWETLTPAGGLDDEGSLDVALRFAFGQALRDAAAAVGSLTPDQVRGILAMTIIGSIVALLSPDPVTKFLFIVTTSNLIAFVGVDLFNNLVKGYLSMAEELAAARDFNAVRAAGERYGERMGPTLARIVLMVATYGVAKFAGLFPGNITSLPGGPRAAALAEAQGFRIPAVEGARSIALSANGTVTIELGVAAAMASVGGSGNHGGRDDDSFDPNEKPDSGKLERNMKEARLTKETGTATHHIVAGEARAAKRAREILARFRIGINDAANGVFLPCNTKTPCTAPGSIHSTLHTDEYFRAVNEALGKARSREEAIRILRDLGAALMAGWKP